MLYFVAVQDRGMPDTSDFLLVSADDETQLRAMIEDGYTSIDWLTTDVEGALNEQYDDMALLCTR